MATFSLLRIPTETRSLSGVSKWKDLPTWSDTWSLCVVFVSATFILIAVFVGARMVFRNWLGAAAGALVRARPVQLPRPGSGGGPSPPARIGGSAGARH